MKLPVPLTSTGGKTHEARGAAGNSRALCFAAHADFPIVTAGGTVAPSLSFDNISISPAPHIGLFRAHMMGNSPGAGERARAHARACALGRAAAGGRVRAGARLRGRTGLRAGAQARAGGARARGEASIFALARKFGANC